MLINANWSLKANKAYKDEAWIGTNRANLEIYSNVKKVFVKIKLMYKVIKLISWAFND